MKLTIIPLAFAVTAMLSACDLPPPAIGGDEPYRPDHSDTTTAATDPTDVNGAAAQDVANDTFGTDAVAAAEVDPGPAVDHAGFADANNNGSSNDEAEATTAAGVVEADVDSAAEDQEGGDEATAEQAGELFG